MQWAMLGSIHQYHRDSVMQEQKLRAVLWSNIKGLFVVNKTTSNVKGLFKSGVASLYLSFSLATFLLVYGTCKIWCMLGDCKACMSV